MRVPELRLRSPKARLLGLPWDLPLSEWTVPDVALRDIAVGPSRHLVKFVEADGALWALKELPPRIARKEYSVLRQLEDLGLPAVRPAGERWRSAMEVRVAESRFFMTRDDSAEFVSSLIARFSAELKYSAYRAS